MGACHGNLERQGGLPAQPPRRRPGVRPPSLTRDALGRRLEPARRSTACPAQADGPGPARRRASRFAADSPEARTLLGWIAAGRRTTIGERAPAEVRCGSSRRSGSSLRAGSTAAARRHGRVRRRHRRATSPARPPSTSATRRGRRSRPTGLVAVRRPVRDRRSRVRYLNGRGVSRLAFLADRPGFVWRGPDRDQPVDTPRLRQAQGAARSTLGAGTDSVFLRRAYLDAIGRLPDPGRGPRVPGRSRPGRSGPGWSIAWSTGPSSPTSGRSSGPTCCGTKRRRWARRASGSSSAGSATRSPRDVPLDEFVRRIVAGAGLDLDQSRRRASTGPTATR